MSYWDWDCVIRDRNYYDCDAIITASYCIQEAQKKKQKEVQKAELQKEEQEQKEKLNRKVTIFQDQNSFELDIKCHNQIYSFLQYRMAILTITDEKMEIALSMEDKKFELREKIGINAKTLSIIEFQTILLELEAIEHGPMEPLHKICCLYKNTPQTITLGNETIRLYYGEISEQVKANQVAEAEKTKTNKSKSSSRSCSCKR